MPKKPRKRTLKQNLIIHARIGKTPDFSADDKAAMVLDITNGRERSTKELSKDEADVMIERLGGSTSPVSVRAAQYHRQKAGVPQIVTQKQLKKIDKGWTRFDHRTDFGLQKLCWNVIKKARPATTKEANKIIEAIKSMNEREDKKPPPTPGTARRVA